MSDVGTEFMLQTRASFTRMSELMEFGCEQHPGSTERIRGLHFDYLESVTESVKRWLEIELLLNCNGDDKVLDRYYSEMDIDKEEELEQMAIDLLTLTNVPALAIVRQLELTIEELVEWQANG